jgi:hypothetical protein
VNFVLKRTKMEWGQIREGRGKATDKEINHHFLLPSLLIRQFPDHRAKSRHWEEPKNKFISRRKIKIISFEP